MMSPMARTSTRHPYALTVTMTNGEHAECLLVRIRYDGTRAVALFDAPELRRLETTAWPPSKGKPESAKRGGQAVPQTG